MNAATDSAADEIKRLNGCINDLSTILALPAIWIGSEPSQIVNILLDALFPTLHLDFAYARLGRGHDVLPSEMVRLPNRQGSDVQARDIGQALDKRLIGEMPVSALCVPNPVG